MPAQNMALKVDDEGNIIFEHQLECTADMSIDFGTTGFATFPFIAKDEGRHIGTVEPKDARFLIGTDGRVMVQHSSPEITLKIKLMSSSERTFDKVDAQRIIGIINCQQAAKKT